MRTRETPLNKTKKPLEVYIMATEDYIETDQERDEGHVDTRSANFECENKDEHLGCDMGIDVAG